MILVWGIFQMTVETDNALAIAIIRLVIGSKNLAPVFQPMRSQIKTNRALHF